MSQACRKLQGAHVDCLRGEYAKAVVRCPFQGHWKWLMSLVHPQQLITAPPRDVAVLQSRLSLAGQEPLCYTRSLWLNPEEADSRPQRLGNRAGEGGRQPRCSSACAQRGPSCPPSIRAKEEMLPRGTAQEGLPPKPALRVQHKAAINVSHQNEVFHRHQNKTQWSA